VIGKTYFPNAKSILVMNSKMLVNKNMTFLCKIKLHNKIISWYWIQSSK